MSEKPNTATQHNLNDKVAENLKERSSKKSRNKVNETDRRQSIATAAYYRAMRRSFNVGNELQDWLEAEAEIDSDLKKDESDCNKSS